ncbi:hypothetical protein IHE45_01G026600 [Dioscorea alata]|uniref:Uncharacterized protein n=1 Tax=Dioscorea alata TaxID=55571 RepID=A0ACB7WTQ8_DIOAL|nr:hypothetical protein IHE45_01G026600 [Dioscorea alata]
MEMNRGRGRGRVIADINGAVINLNQELGRMRRQATQLLQTQYVLEYKVDQLVYIDGLAQENVPMAAQQDISMEAQQDVPMAAQLHEEKVEPFMAEQQQQ